MGSRRALPAPVFVVFRTTVLTVFFASTANEFIFRTRLKLPFLLGVFGLGGWGVVGLCPSLFKYGQS